MKTLVVYYSRSGVTRTLAEYIAKDVGADIEEIEGGKRGGALGFVVSGYQSMGGKNASIGPIKSKVGEYDVVVIATPIWAGQPSSPTNAFLTNYGGEVKNYAVVFTRANAKNDYAQVTEAFIGKLKKEPLAFLSMCSKMVKDGSYAAADSFIETIKSLDVK